MRIARALVAAMAAAGIATAAAASDVRILALPDHLQGAWAPSDEACRSQGSDRLDIAARKVTMPDSACEIAWITVTAARDGPSYSARSVCTQAGTGRPEGPSYLLITPLPDDTLLVRRPSGYADSVPVTYRKC